MVSDEKIVLMKKACVTLAALMLTGCGSLQAQEQVTEKPTTTTAETTVTAETSEYDTFFGVLMDECCSDIDDPTVHETNCMFMDGCCESGYGLDIKQADGSWLFFKFDDKGQQLTWEYINSTERQDGLFVTVTGTLENEIIKVISIEES